jgi:phenylpropionate dioxygenase-like ring-hydroxylating dioxygenase large terminal subunit
MPSSSNGHATPRLPQTHYLDNRIFTDEAIFAEEQERIFGKVWQFVCHESEVAKPGDFRCVKVAGKSVILARGDDGVIRGFHNICRHRAAEVVREESGHARMFTCFYHHWTYGLKGELRGVAKPAGYEAVNLDKSELGLVPVRCELIAGLVFVNLDDSACPLRDFIGADIAEGFEQQLGTAPLEVFHFHKAVLRTNWKLWQDNNSERYHAMLHVANRKTLPWVLGNTSPMRLRIAANGHSGYWADGGDAPVQLERGGYERFTLDPLPGMRPDEMRVMNLFPDLMINIRTSVVRLDRMVPLGPDSTLVEWRGLGARTDDEKTRALQVRQHNLFWGPTGRNLPEDVLAVESQSRAMTADGVRYSIVAREENLNPTDDANLRAYYQEWGRRMGRSAAAPLT